MKNFEFENELKNPFFCLYLVSLIIAVKTAHHGIFFFLIYNFTSLNTDCTLLFPYVNKNYATISIIKEATKILSPILKVHLSIVLSV